MRQIKLVLAFLVTLGFSLVWIDYLTHNQLLYATKDYFLLESQVDNKRVEIPQRVVKPKPEFSSLALNKTPPDKLSSHQQKSLKELNEAEILVPPRDNQTTKTHKLNHADNPYLVCTRSGKEEIKVKKHGGLYVWVDDSGVRHISSQQPDLDLQKVEYVGGESSLDYFDLKLDVTGLSAQFKPELSAKITQIFKYYHALVGFGLLQKVYIDQHMFADRVDYLNFAEENSYADADNASGFYLHKSKKAAILMQHSEAKTLSVSLHEASHAIHHGIFGQLPRWLNEGLSEYNENLSIRYQTKHFLPNPSWSNNNYISAKLLPLKQLLNATKTDWDGELRQSLYATSWSFIYYLMDSPERKSALAQLLIYEQQQACSQVVASDLERYLARSLDLIQSDFSTWQRRALRQHQF
ncbi:hypothetical protein [Catenovulum maritimum]|uniref:DUF1570 domain-containing protein n=1 Tax=Catenovulum maritimum TaxID=1513271 RepID=A0A0J8H003_9ALTE|nr:hypothetical protein [Catenovulum maritimum]KMT66809.1 hypothetical protein XM47_01435 [Catenovulum maritimum]